MKSDALARLRTFPKAPSPNDDASAIRGNLNLDQKQLGANILAYHVAAQTKVFASDALKDLKLVEINVRPKSASGDSSRTEGSEDLEGEAICEIKVSEGEISETSGDREKDDDLTYLAEGC